MTAAHPRQWPTLSTFYAQDLRRARSHELQVGSMWKTDDAAPPWRAAWLETTGEFFVVRYDGPHDHDPGPVEVLGILPDRFTVEVGLRGWWHTCGYQGSLAWLRARVGQLAAPPH